MAPRLPFALVYFADLSAAEVVRQDEFSGNVTLTREDMNTTKDVLVNDGAAEPIVVQGKILQIGFKTHLSQLRVKKDGSMADINETTSNVAQSRKKTLAERVRRIAHARANNLTNLEEILEKEGPDALPCPPPTQYKCRLPKHRRPEDLHVLQIQMDNLPCFQEDAASVHLGGGVYISAAALACALIYHKKHQAALFREVMKILVPTYLLSHSGVTVGGTRGTVAVPKMIVTAASSYAKKNALTTSSSFDALVSLRNLLYDMQNPDAKKRKLPDYNSNIDNSTVNQTETEQTETAVAGQTATTQGHDEGEAVFTIM